MRRFARLLLVVLFVLIAGWFPLLAPTPHRIDQAHFELIQHGMTKADVEAIFGVPPGQYDCAEIDDALVWFIDVTPGNVQPRALDVVRHQFVYDLSETVAPGDCWVSRHGACTVYFDDQGRVAFKSGWNAVRIEPPWKRWWGYVWKK